MLTIFFTFPWISRRILGCLIVGLHHHENVFFFFFLRVSKKGTLEFLKIFFITNECIGSAFTCLRVFACFQSRPFEMRVDKCCWDNSSFVEYGCSRVHFELRTWLFPPAHCELADDVSSKECGTSVLQFVTLLSFSWRVWQCVLHLCSNASSSITPGPHLFRDDRCSPSVIRWHTRLQSTTLSVGYCQQSWVLKRPCGCHLWLRQLAFYISTKQIK